jgi:hypothetical protein
MTVTSDAAVLKVLGDLPRSTWDVQNLLAQDAGIDFEDVPIYRLRRTLARLEAKGEVVASGGPKRPDLPDWPSGDGRDVYWASKKVADAIATRHVEREELRAEIEHEREGLLRDLYKVLRPFEREALGVTGLPTKIRSLKAEHGTLPYDLDESGPLGWDIRTLRVVAGTIIECRGG